MQLSQAAQEELTEHIERFFILRSLSESVEGLAEAVEWIEGGRNPRKSRYKTSCHFSNSFRRKFLKSRITGSDG